MYLAVKKSYHEFFVNMFKKISLNIADARGDFFALVDFVAAAD